VRKAAAPKTGVPSEPDWRGFLGFVLFVIGVSVVYGICHDLVTASVNKAYFLPPIHPIIINTNSPVVLALFWGVIATWWAGLIFGGIIGYANIAGPKPSLPWRQLKRQIAIILPAIWVTAMIVLAGIYLYYRKQGEDDARIIAVATTHNWSYLLTTIYAIFMTFQVRQKRKNQKK